MAKQKAIQDFNLIYWIFRPLVCWGAICHYNSFTVRGKENLPKEGGYMLAPCHQQALMEPLAVLSVVRKNPVFLARADIFAQPTIRKILTFLKIMPVYRIRDGKESLSKNAEIFEKSRSVVLGGYPFCMMAEGRHNDKHQLLPLVKGMFRIAGETQRSLGSTPLYILPTGIDFDEYEEPYANLCINIGEPIPVQQFMETFETNEPVALNQMRDVISAGMSRQMHDIKSKAHYEEHLTLSNILNKEERKKEHLRNSAFNRFLTRQKIARKLDEMESNEDANHPVLMEKTAQYRSLCKKSKVSEKTESAQWNKFHMALSLLIVCLFAYAFITCAPVRWATLFILACFPMMVLPTHLLVPKFIKDTQFRSSINYGIRFFVSIIYTLIFAAVMGITQGGAWHDIFPNLHGFWWWLAAFDIPLVMAYFNGPLNTWLKNFWRNLRFFYRRPFIHKSAREMKELRKEIYAIYNK